MNDITERILRIISNKGLKHGFVAERAGFSQKDFSNILHGRKTFKAEYVMPVCTALDITPDELFGVSAGKSE